MVKRKPLRRGIRERFLTDRPRYWCWGDRAKVPIRRTILGPFESEAIAYETGFSAYPGHFRVFLLPTKEVEHAKQFCKAKDVEEGLSIDEAMRYSSDKF